MKSHKCRDCQALREITWKERDFGRIICYKCGGTCDPISAEIKRVDKIRTKAREQRTKEARFAAGW